MAKKHLVLIGGGHAHMVTLAKLHLFTERGYKFTVIQPSDHHYYSGMGPGMLGGTYTPEEIRFNTRRVVVCQGGDFIRGKALQIDPISQTVLLEGTGEKISYDVLSCNAGSFVPHKMIPDSHTVFTVKPIEGLMNARQEIVRQGEKKTLNIAIIGGGPSAIEIAGNVWQLSQQENVQPITLRIFAGSRLMGTLPRKIRLLALRVFKKRGIEVIEGSYVKETVNGQVRLMDGRIYKADIIFPAVGVEPSEIFKRSGLPTGPDGGLLVNRYLQSVKYKNIFGGGDCISFQPRPLDKVGVYAVRENPVLFHNLLAALEGSELIPFDPGGKYLLIYNLGGGIGIFCKWFFIISGRLPFYLKDFIDRKFMTKFQSIEQQFEPQNPKT